MTLEQFLQLPGAKRHDGGKQPVDDFVIVEVHYRASANLAKGVRIDWPYMAARFAWHHDGQDDDIIAYREAP